MRRSGTLIFLGALAAGAVCAMRPLKAVDLHVYHAAARSFFLQNGPMYGANQEFGWPSLYRYPPLFLCLFRPLASLPFRVVVGIWAAFEVLALGPLIRIWYRRHPPARFGPELCFSALILLPYLLYGLQVGNAQLLLVEMVCLALLVSDEHPFIASFLLGLGTAIKVWPALILPFLAVRKRWRIVGITPVAAAIFTALPGFWLGWGKLIHLFEEWYFQELKINALLGDRWYPSQSLRGVMLRYLTCMNYSGLPDQNYRHVNFLSLPSWEVRQFWLALAIALGALALVWAWRCASDCAAHSIFFCTLLILEPNVQHLAYTAMLWPVLCSGVVLMDPRTPQSSKWILRGSAAIAVLQPLIPGAATQRLFQVLGIDFFGVLVPLTLALLISSSWGMTSPLWPRRASIAPCRPLIE